MSGDFSKVKESLVDKILEQGQKLRNAMVQSILQNDPLTGDVWSTKHHNTPQSSTSSLLSDKKLLEAFINGDYLTKEEETVALNTIRSLPPSEVETTINKCSCKTCKEYHGNNLKCHLRRTPDCDKKQFVGSVNLSLLLKQVDSLKVILQSIHLNSQGNKKVSKSGLFSSSGLNETYFVEYLIPEVFCKEGRHKSKIDSGLENNHVRVCARRTSNVIHIRQTYTHNVQNLYNFNLEDYDLIFYIRYKTPSIKKSELLGITKFNLGLFKTIFSCGKTLPIFLNEESQISVGSLKVTIQLGAEKLYFGQEFIDAVSQKDVGSDDSDETIPVELEKPKQSKTVLPESIKFVEKKKVDLPKPLRTVHHEPITIVPENKTLIIETPKTVPTELYSKQSEPTPQPTSEENLLFGFLYISESQFLQAHPNSYILCRPYCQDDTSSSRVVSDSRSPLYNFCQTIPLIYDQNFLLKLRENSMVLEFWQKDSCDELFGLAKLPLHQFYLAYRNAIILNHLRKNKLPIIGSDWWEPIYNIENTNLIGQVQVLTALGTQEQITNLELERGFKNEVVKSKILKPYLEPKQPSSYFADRAKVNKRHLTRKIDKAIQSDLDKMDKKPEEIPDKSQELMANFLKLLEKQRPTAVENSTNTEPEQLPIKKTTDLLESLQKSLSVPKNPEKPPHFKAKIVIKEANQLPVRRKIKSKSKRIKGKSPKQDDNVLPSTYVTFETLPGETLQCTSVCPRESSPQWNYQSDVCLPMDLLIDSQKRLIFKVWKKSTNTVMQPNMQTDMVLGFAALDLSVLTLGFPNIQGWFNIIDFSGKINGQINIHVTPLEQLMVENGNFNDCDIKIPESLEGNELLSRALKRKFTELDEITQRLRLRLSEVVTDDNENSNDAVADEFESDINSICIEDDFDLIDFEDEARKLSAKLNKAKLEQSAQKLNDLVGESMPGTSKEGSSQEGKHRIDSLLEKLSLIQSEPASSRYVSGCSAVSTSENPNNLQVIFNDLDQGSRPNITASQFDSVLFKKLCDSGRDTPEGDSETKDK